MGLTLVSLKAASANGLGAALTFDKPRCPVAMQVVAIGGAAFWVALEGSLDGENWVQLTGTSNSGMVSSTIPVMAIRANLTSISGGSNAAITALLSAAD